MSCAPKNTVDWMPLELGDASPCPYLEPRLSQIAFGLALPSGEQLDTLLAHGFRRLGFVFYLPRCPGECRECRPLRVPLDRFVLSRSQRRLLRRASGRYRVRELSPHFDAAHFELYQRHARWVSEANPACTPQDYRSAFVDSAVTTHLFEFRIDEQLVGVSILDEGPRAVSSVYAFWDPAHARDSPGTFSALWEIAWARELGKSHYYLGYWVPGCPQMSYKNRFRPHELYDWNQQRWLAAGP